jgi:endonuclease/exonuclease/phosphatase family metal-dependent hydrolase
MNITKIINLLLFFTFSCFSTFINSNTERNILTPNWPILTFNDNDKLSVMTINTWGLPIWYPKSNKSERYNDIKEFINTIDYDIISLQEVFDRKLITKLLEEKPSKYHLESDYNCKRSSTMGISMDCYGGLMTLSKHPILEEYFYQFPILEDYKLDEKIGRKGFLVSTILTPKCTLTVINTHLYSGSNANDEKHRLEQVSYMYKIINQNPKFNNNPMLLLGDLNIQHPCTLAPHEEEKDLYMTS